ncbi:MAG: hypothetical protein R6W73_00455 [Candidatus Saliniplasma sp.]
MYDYLSSKIVWIIAVLVMTSSILGIFVWQRESSEEVELEVRARGIKDIINEFCTTNGEVKAEFSFNSNADSDFDLEPTINDKTYRLNFTARGLYINQDQKQAWNRFTKEVYLYNPYFLGRSESKGVLDTINSEVEYLNIPSHQDFFVETKEFNQRYHVFIYHESPEKVENETERIRNIMQDVYDWSFDNPENKQNITLREDTVFKNEYYFVRERSIKPVITENIFLWEAETNTTTWDELEDLSAENDEIFMNEGENITIETTVMEIDESHSVLNFLYRS